MPARPQHVLNRLSAHLDGELSPRAEARLTRHLAGCQGCRESSWRLRRVVRLLDHLGAVPLPDDLWTSLVHRLTHRSQLARIRK
jgi:anti-sigma factor RsiW